MSHPLVSVSSLRTQVCKTQKGRSNDENNQDDDCDDDDDDDEREREERPFEWKDPWLQYVFTIVFSNCSIFLEPKDCL